MKPSVQIYANYTAEDFWVWETLFNRQMANLDGKVADAYLEALKKVRFAPDAIPEFGELNRLLNEYTSWQIMTVPNITEQKFFFEHLSKKQFTATCWLRKPSELDYLEEPDMFHDVFAHVPLLSNQAYCTFFKGLGDIALKYLDEPEIIKRLGRLYWFTIEFGLIRENNVLKIYGAGVISSASETKHALSDHSVKKPFSLEEIFETDFRNDIIQSTYFIIDSFEQLENSLPEIESLVVPHLRQA